VISRAWVALLVWAAMLAALTAIQFVFSTNPYYWATLGGSALATALFAGYYLWRPPLRGAEYVGPWLWLPGLGLLAVGLGGIVNELRVERRRG
jgi:hypothetical protein